MTYVSFEKLSSSSNTTEVFQSLVSKISMQSADRSSKSTLTRQKFSWQNQRKKPTSKKTNAQ